MPDKKVILITGTPEGPGIPEEIRKGWVGALLEAEGPLNIAVGSALDIQNYQGVHTVYDVPSNYALAVLRTHNPELWKWFSRQPNIAPIFSFDAKCCKEMQ